MNIPYGKKSTFWIIYILVLNWFNLCNIFSSQKYFYFFLAINFVTFSFMIFFFFFSVFLVIFLFFVISYKIHECNDYYIYLYLLKLSWTELWLSIRNFENEKEQKLSKGKIIPSFYSNQYSLLWNLLFIILPKQNERLPSSSSCCTYHWRWSAGIFLML